MLIEKILNNNVVVVKDEKHREKIVMGRGLAFKKKVGDEFDDSLVDKVFNLSSSEVVNKFQELVVDIPIEHMEFGEEIITYATEKTGKKLNEMVYITLIDHIYTSITRFLDGITVKNVLLWDIKRFYPDEFSIGLHTLDLIEEKFHVRLPEDEAGFIALHIVNAQMDAESINDMYQITKLIQEIINIVKYTFNVAFNEESVAYYRFVTHLKFFSMRIINKKCYEDENDNELFEVVKKKYKNSFKCVENISKFIYKKYDYELSKEEELYLMIHIERVIYKSTKH